MNANKSTNEKERLASPTTPPLETLEDMLHNRILEKKHKIHKNQSMVDTEKLLTETETLRWVLGESLILRRRFGESE